MKRSIAQRPNYNQHDGIFDYLYRPAVILSFHAYDGTIGGSKKVKTVKSIGYPGTCSGKKPFRDIAKGIYIYGDVFDSNEHDDNYVTEEEFVELIITDNSPLYSEALKSNKVQMYDNLDLSEVHSNLGWI